ncbi:MAG: DUF58 domain-containing protein [Anaerolineaceae bacterium]|nr:DUF58 domain-containing protein [Anaerolineaceae bacterium]
MADFLPFLIFLMILAVFLQAGPALTVFYLIIGSFLLGLWWQKRALKHLKVTRHFMDHAYLGETVRIELTIENTSLLPILWLEVHESLPVNLRAGRDIKEVFSLGLRSKKTIQYEINAFKRGYYPIGPLIVESGDPLGLTKPSQISIPESNLTIYPRIVDLATLGLPSRSPFGTIRNENPVYEDPTRLMGKRGFQNGDSIRKIDWKSSASSGDLLVKLYEASIALELAVLLDLDKASYEMDSFYDATELAITAAASLAAWSKRHQQSVGLFTNGLDPLSAETGSHALPPRKGASHLISLLELLARIQPGTTCPVGPWLQDTRGQLSWGTTLIYISGKISPETFEQLFQARKAGSNPVILLTGQPHDVQSDRRIAAGYHIPIYTATSIFEVETLGVPQ